MQINNTPAGSRLAGVRICCTNFTLHTAMSATVSNSDLTYIKLEEGKGFTVPEGQSLNVCIAVKEGDSELQGKLDEALKKIGWNQDKMNELMETAVTLQPLGE